MRTVSLTSYRVLSSRERLVQPANRALQLPPGTYISGLTNATPAIQLWSVLTTAMATRLGQPLYRQNDWHDILPTGFQNATMHELLRPSEYRNVLTFTEAISCSTPAASRHLISRPHTKLHTQSCCITVEFSASGRGHLGTATRTVTAYLRQAQTEYNWRGQLGLHVGNWEGLNVNAMVTDLLADAGGIALHLKRQHLRHPHQGGSPGLGKR